MLWSYNGSMLVLIKTTNKQDAYTKLLTWYESFCKKDKLQKEIPKLIRKSWAF